MQGQRIFSNGEMSHGGGCDSASSVASLRYSSGKITCGTSDLALLGECTIGIEKRRQLNATETNR